MISVKENFCIETDTIQEAVDHINREEPEYFNQYYGDAHVLIDEANQKEELELCKKVEPVISRINNKEDLAFHLVSEISEGNVSNLVEATKWFERSLAHHQHLLGNEEDLEVLLNSVFNQLLSCGAIVASKNGYKVQATAIGKISSWYYFSPFDVANWTENFKNIMTSDEKPKPEELSWAVGHIHNNIKEYPSTLDEALLNYRQKVKRDLHGGATRHCYALYCLMTGYKPESPDIGTLMTKYRMDVDRISTAIQALHLVGKYFDKTTHQHVIYELPFRLKYGVDRGLELVILPGVGGKTAEHIMSRRVYTCKELVAAQNSGVPVLKAERWEKIRHIAEEIARVGHVEYLKRLSRGKKRK